MKNYTLTLPLNKNYNNCYIEANSVTIEVSTENVTAMMQAIKSIDKAVSATQIRIPLRGSIDWQKNGEVAEDRLDNDELIIFKDGEMAVTASEKHNGIDIKSVLFRIAEVDDLLHGFSLKESSSEQFCVICCCEHEFKDNECTACGNHQSDAVSDRDEQIENFSLENKNMTQALIDLGYSQEQVSLICSGTKVASKLTDENIKAYSVSVFTSDSKNGAVDYDEMMDGSSDLTPWSPFENFPKESMQEVTEEMFNSISAWFAPSLVEEKDTKEYILILNGIENETASVYRVIEYAKNKLLANPDDAPDFGFDLDKIGIEQAIYIIRAYDEDISFAE